MTRILLRTVMFADLRGSTALYESLGNTEATAVVTQSVAIATDVVVGCAGVVVKTLGDGLMAVFEDASDALRASDDMHESLERVTAHAATLGLEGRALAGLKLQVALAHGEIVEMAGDCFGDAVNVAARLLDHAGDNETLATAGVLEQLGAVDQARFRSLDRMQLRGRAEPVHVHLLETHAYSDAAETAYLDIVATPEPEGIRLIWQHMNRVFAPVKLPIVLGRSPQTTYCIDDQRVSRSHARIDWHGGTFQLTDLSYNGTYVRFTNDAQIVSLRRGTCTLHGSGLIGLGGPPDEAGAPCVRFEVMRFSTTTPHALHDGLEAETAPGPLDDADPPTD